MTASEAAAELGVALPTLYAYVSRGMIRSEARAGRRSRLYRAEDVRALAARKMASPTDGAAGDRALDWGAPLLESAITLIADGRLYYRGRDAARLAETASLETVAGLVWERAEDDPFALPPPEVPEGLPPLPGLRPLDRCLAALPIIAAADPAQHNPTPTGIAATGARLVRWIAALSVGGVPDGRPIHRFLAQSWDAPPAADELIRAALVLCIDHELNASTFTVRCVASTGAGPYGAAMAGLAALQGPRHGGLTERVVVALPALLEAADPAAAVADRLRRGDGLPGFGHPLYPDGDPRAEALLAMMRRALPDHPDIAAGLRLAEAAKAVAGQPPTVDFALGLLERTLALPSGSALAIFAIGRTVGWVGHAMEQYRDARLIRPRARYVGAHR